VSRKTEKLLPRYLDVLLLDQTESVRLGKTFQESGAFLTIVAIVLTMLLTSLMVLVLWWLMGFLVHDSAFRILGCSIVISMLNQGDSGSAVTRTVYGSIPVSLVAVLAYNSLGFWGFFALLMMHFVITIPELILKELNT
jgi:hypothetical protein